MADPLHYITIQWQWQCSAEYGCGAIGAESIVGRLSQALLKQCWRSNDEDDDRDDDDVDDNNNDDADADDANADNDDDDDAAAADDDDDENAMKKGLQDTLECTVCIAQRYQSGIN